MYLIIPILTSTQSVLERKKTLPTINYSSLIDTQYLSRNAKKTVIALKKVDEKLIKRNTL